jgi:hypothetical protein
MKTETETLGGAQIPIGISFNLQDSFEEYLTAEHRCFLSMLRLMEAAQPSIAMIRKGRRRIPYENEPIMRDFLAWHFLRIATVEGLRNRLLNDPNLRIICGFLDGVPSAPMFSRRMTGFCSKPLMIQTLNSMVADYQKYRLVGHINRDFTAIPVRETPVNKKRDVAPHKKVKHRHGQPRKGEVRPAKEPTTVELQAGRSARNSLSKLPRECAWDCKKNSQGKVLYWKRYKLHLDVTDIGLPITAIVTGANVHDSQAAIPMEKLPVRRSSTCTRSWMPPTTRNRSSSTSVVRTAFRSSIRTTGKTRTRDHLTRPRKSATKPGRQSSAPTCISKIG